MPVHLFLLADQRILPPFHEYGHANHARSPARGMALIKYEAEFTQQFSISKKLVHNKDMTTLSI